MNTMTKEEARKAIRSYFPDKGNPFVVELEFIKDFSDERVEELAIKLMESMMNSEEILPGLKVSKIYRQIETPESIHVDLTSKKVRKIQEEIKSLEDMYINKLEELKKACRKVYNNEH